MMVPRFRLVLHYPGDTRGRDCQWRASSGRSSIYWNGILSSSGKGGDASGRIWDFSISTLLIAWHMYLCIKWPHPGGVHRSFSYPGTENGIRKVGKGRRIYSTVTTFWSYVLASACSCRTCQPVYMPFVHSSVIYSIDRFNVHGLSITWRYFLFRPFNVSIVLSSMLCVHHIRTISCCLQNN